MEFTVHLRSEETYGEDHTYGLVFTPHPTWVQGRRVAASVKGGEPGYQVGGVRVLLRQEKLTRRLPRPRSATILVHHVGLGTARDYQQLIVDLESEGFATTLFD